jgi:uncharacterized LabA/DUF88 family protein
VNQSANRPPLHSAVPCTAVFIDGDWFIHAISRLNIIIDYGQLADAIRATFGAGTRLSFFMGIDGSSPEHLAFAKALTNAGFEIESVPLRRIGDRVVSKGVDVLLSVKGASLPSDVDRFVLASGDNDFVPLLKELKGKGVSTALLGLPIITSHTLTESAMRFVSLEDLLAGTAVRSAASEPNGTLIRPPAEIYVEKGQHFGPYLIIRRLFKSAQHRITLIDPYIDDQVFEILTLVSPSVEVFVFTNKIQISDYMTIIAKFRREGRKIRLFRTKEFHDRYLRVDDEWWHSGHSFKDLGNADSRLSCVRDEGFIAKLRERETELARTATELSPS